VHLFAHGADRGRSEGLSIHPRNDLGDFAKCFDADVLIAIPEVLPILMPLRARARIVWTGNAFANGDCAIAAPWHWASGIGRAGETARLYSVTALDRYVDAYAVKSRWQADYLRSTLGVAAGKIRVVHNGVQLDDFRGPRPRRHRHRIVYTSESRRGLDVLLQLFPAVRHLVPEAELHVFGYEYETAAPPPNLQNTKQAGVCWRGGLNKKELAEELRSAAIFAYPCRFKETFCTAVAEAQAAGLPVVATDLAALSERVTNDIDGFLLPGRPDDEGYQAVFVATVVRLLSDDDLWRRMGLAASEKALRDYDQDAITTQWEEHFDRWIVGRSPAEPNLDSALDFRDPTLLRISDRGRVATVPAELAEQWLRSAWAAYGFDSGSVPGLA
jgi:glycosyltransferase involved in cell wall biosynthesis